MSGASHTDRADGFLAELYRGSVEWSLLDPFPQQAPADAARGDHVRAELVELLRRSVDPTAVDARRQLPDGLVEELKARGFLRLQAPREVGGLALSDMNTFRVVQTAASWSVPVALTMAIENTVGLAPFLSALPSKLREAMQRHVAGGDVSGSADTEPAGAANKRRTTTATPTDDGRGYVLRGEKIHVGNAPLADVLSVSAAVREAESESVRLFFVETDRPGFDLKARHEFMGVKGFPNGNVTLDDVYVERERMLVEEGDSVEAMPELDRLTPELNRRLFVGRMHLIGAPSLAIAKVCAEWSRNFCRRRAIDGRPLGDYEWIQRIVAATVADVFAIESVCRWCLLAGEDPTGDGRRYDATLEQNAAKNITSVAAWRVVDRTMSLLAGEGYETAQSKARRGAPPLPVERNFRDARNFRISGGVDFQLDNWTGSLAILPLYYAGDDRPRKQPPGDAPPRDLSPRNDRHRAFVEERAAELSAACRELVSRHPDPHDLYARERFPTALSRIANELLTMSLVLARASSRAGSSGDRVQDIADVFCSGARRRVRSQWEELRGEDPPAHDRIASAWLAGEDLDGLLADALAEVPPA
uniref:Acyl-CoA dehydrogenase n=1 Tax=uncultured bacterium AB_162 TaxID=1630011 RepID=A0A0E3M1Q8_9BACT|nr:acyl-CoA dehydrogenase [uncultured bacterium AB_162]